MKFLQGSEETSFSPALRAGVKKSFRLFCFGQRPAFTAPRPHRKSFFLLEASLWAARFARPTEASRKPPARPARPREASK